jgi:hypothetical protein
VSGLQADVDTVVWVAWSKEEHRWSHAWYTSSAVQAAVPADVWQGSRNK